jgi:hypothetical protein
MTGRSVKRPVFEGEFVAINRNYRSNAKESLED